MSTPPNAQAYFTVRGTLVRERTMRERVFAHKPDTLSAKLAEIDRALDALDTLLTTTQWQPVTRLEYKNPDTDPTYWHYDLYVNGNVLGLTDAEDGDNWREIQLPPHLRLCLRVADATAEPARPTLFDTA
jgi:hypothetical protein